MFCKWSAHTPLKFPLIRQPDVVPQKRRLMNIFECLPGETLISSGAACWKRWGLYSWKQSRWWHPNNINSIDPQCKLNVFWQHLIVEQQVLCIFNDARISARKHAGGWEGWGGGVEKLFAYTFLLPLPITSAAPLPNLLSCIWEDWQYFSFFFFFWFNFICHLCRGDKRGIYVM